jgi:hypothetical protein
MNVKTVIKKVYVKFCEYSRDGTSYTIAGGDMAEAYDRDNDFKFLCEVVVPEVDRAELVGLGETALNKKIAEHSASITALEVKKQQLLAIEHKGDNDE